MAGDVAAYAQVQKENMLLLVTAQGNPYNAGRRASPLVLHKECRPPAGSLDKLCHRNGDSAAPIHWEFSYPFVQPSFF